MAADERIHEEVVRGLAARGRARVSGSFRAAVFGANDGLVSNLALVLGVSGGGAASSTVLLTGLAGLLAGALSMGAGEYVSVRSQRELLAASSPNQATATAVPYLDVDANELALVYRARGMGADEALKRAAESLRHHRLDTDAEGVADDHDVVGTGLGAALSSFVFFASGALVPVLPFLFGLSGTAALVLAARPRQPGAAAHRGDRGDPVRRAAAAPRAAPARDRRRRRRDDVPARDAVRRHPGLTRLGRAAGFAGAPAKPTLPRGYNPGEVRTSPGQQARGCPPRLPRSPAWHVRRRPAPY